MTSNYPSDDATRIITGCAEVICEIESASNLPVRAICVQVRGRRRRVRVDSGRQRFYNHPVPVSPQRRRGWLRNLFKRSRI